MPHTPVRRPATGPPPGPRVPPDPLFPAVLAAVIALAAAVVAVTLLPLAGTLAAGVRRVNEQLAVLGEDFRRIRPFAERSLVYAADGEVLAALYQENRTEVALEDVSPVARKAVLAIEDDRFYEHGAVDATSVLRALVANLVAGEVVQGGSTITQQLVKNVFIEDPSQTLDRKLREAALAIRLEQRYSKDRILEMYLNRVYLGNGVYGIGTAAEFYFGVPAAELRLPQAALLAGMIASPETYDPLERPRAALRRRNEVLDRLAALGWVPRAKVERAKRRPLGLDRDAAAEQPGRWPFAVEYVRRLILDSPGGEFDALGATRRERARALFEGGLRIHTTFLPGWEEAAAAAVAARLPDPEGPDAAIVAVEAGTGAIRTMFSGRGYLRDPEPLDLVTAARQPGSSFKPFTLVAAFRAGVPPGKVYPSKAPYRDPRWNNDCHCVFNAEGRGDRGYLDLWAATEDSVNVVFAQLVLDLGPEAVVEAARDLGVTSPLDAVPSITLGAEEVSPLEMAAAYATLAGGGVRCEPFAVARIEDPRGRVLYRHRPECRRVLEADVANLVTAMLQRAVAGGTGRAAALPGRPVAGKTGTTQDYTNAWFVGYTRQVAAAVWVGFPEGQRPMDGYFGGPVFGGTVAAPIWHDFMARAVAGMPVEGFPPPPPPERAPVPDLLGLRGARAEEAVLAAGFTPLLEEVDAPEPEGTVVGQEPAAGTRIALGGLVRILVSTGRPPTVEVPDVVGLRGWRAVLALEEAGLVARVERTPVEDPAEQGVVLAQAPPAGERVPAGSEVTITVGEATGPGRPGAAEARPSDDHRRRGRAVG
ncbi:MAG TPA: transglycosylase domain-containing protein [Actinomycetota bacterium]|nr:transglycosylase domain-containing protein [Actinomycetota bacterium]